jgi:hypothetical protein
MRRFLPPFLLVGSMMGLILYLNHSSASEGKISDAAPAPQSVIPVVGQETSVSTIVEIDQVKRANIAVPYVNESPDGSWTGSWKNACEEATITMIDAYYRGDKSVSIESAMAYMQTLFDAQKAASGSDANSDAAVTLGLIQTYAHFGATIVENPTIEAIKAELDAGRPIIALHHGFDLGNKNIPFLATGSSYHATVIKGYDDADQEFIVNDTGDDIDGPDHRYDYAVYMNSLHDYQYTTKLADGPPRVIFTFKQ